ncbi:MAG: hypothetical protein Q7U28_10330 [Aquabacterium sp.]|nr:hypothetical protein [Aquabacterium sp.]
MSLSWLTLIVPAAATAAPQIDGDVIIANSHAGQVVVMPDGFKLGVKVKPCLLGICLPVSVGIDVPNLLPPVNINSVLITGNGRVMGNVLISGSTPSLVVVSSGSNINSVWAK